MQKNDLRVDREDASVLALTLRRRYLLTFPLESAARMLNKGFKIIINN